MSLVVSSCGADYRVEDGRGRAGLNQRLAIVTTDHSREPLLVVGGMVTKCCILMDGAKSAIKELQIGCKGS